MIEPGTYVATPVSAIYTLVGQNSTECVKVLFRTDDGDEVMLDGWLTPKAAEHTFRKLRICGWRGDDVSAIEFDPEARVRIVVDHEEYNGKTYAKVTFVNPLRSSFEPAPAEEAKKWVALAKSVKLSAADGGRSEDDIPF